MASTLIPPVQVNPDDIPHLTPWGLWINVTNVPSMDTHSPPPWTLELESHYQKFHPRIWYILGTDDALDQRTIAEYQQRIATLAEISGCAAEDETAELEAALTELTRRWWGRWYALYGLYVAREAYLAYMAKQYPHLSLSDILYKHTEPGRMDGAAISVPVGKLWPLPIDPPEPNLITLVHSVDWSEHILPDFRTPESDASERSVLQQSAGDCTDEGGGRRPQSGSVVRRVVV
ncbi:hypothetical protein JCM10450v2_005558 [Rhodotorula kratochvilovae]